MRLQQAHQASDHAEAYVLASNGVRLESCHKARPLAALCSQPILAKLYQRRDCDVNVEGRRAVQREAEDKSRCARPVLLRPMIVELQYVAERNERIRLAHQHVTPPNIQHRAKDAQDSVY